MAILKPVRKRKARFLLAVFAAFLTFALPSAGVAQPLRLQEQKIKAGLLYNFIKYSSWPDRVFRGPGDAFQVCLLGGDAFDGALDPLQGRTAQQRSINIRKISRPDLPGNCHVVFINRAEQGNLPAILKTLRDQPILTVSDIESFSNKGGMVEFSRPSEKRIQLYLDKRVAESAGLHVGEQLLKLAEIR